MTTNKYINTVILLLIGLTILTGCAHNHPEDLNRTKSLSKNKQNNSEMINIDKASHATVSSKLISFSTAYKVKVNSQTYTLTGDFIHFYGDTLCFKNSNGEEIFSEKQHKRYGFKLNRMASIHDSNNNITGYIGEDFSKDYWNPLEIFHIYNSNGSEIATVKENWSLIKSFTVKDNHGTHAYKITKKIASIANVYTIEKLNETEIPMSSIILVTTISDAINAQNEDN